MSAPSIISATCAAIANTWHGVEGGSEHRRGYPRPWRAPARQDIADYLGLNETVSRTLTRFENASVIALPCSKRIVLNRPALKRLVEGDRKPALGMDKGGPKAKRFTER